MSKEKRSETIEQSTNDECAVTLTEREWDHIILSIENDLKRDYVNVQKSVETNIPFQGLDRMRGRYREIHRKICSQLGWNTVRMKLDLQTQWRQAD